MLSARFAINTWGMGLAFALAVLAWRGRVLSLVSLRPPFLSDVCLNNGLSRVGHACRDTGLRLFLHNLGQRRVSASYMHGLFYKGHVCVGVGHLFGLYGTGLR